MRDPSPLASLVTQHEFEGQLYLSQRRSERRQSDDGEQYSSLHLQKFTVRNRATDYSVTLTWFCLTQDYRLSRFPAFLLSCLIFTHGESRCGLANVPPT